MVAQEAGGVLAHGTEALDHHAGALELEIAVAHRDVGTIAEPPARGADLVQGNTAHFPRQTDDAVDLVLDPGHALLVRAHVRGQYVLLDVPKRAGQSAYDAFLLIRRHLGIAEDDYLAAAVGEAGGGVLHGHGPGQADALLGAHVRRHADSADGRTLGHVVDDQHRLETDGWLVDVENLRGAEVIGELEHVGHTAGLLQRCFYKLDHEDD
jgi:hypothetical protein